MDVLAEIKELNEKKRELETRARERLAALAEEVASLEGFIWSLSSARPSGASSPKKRNRITRGPPRVGSLLAKVLAATPVAPGLPTAEIAALLGKKSGSIAACLSVLKSAGRVAHANGRYMQPSIAA